MPTLVISAGPNGSGKTTLVEAGVLNEHFPVPERPINADALARPALDPPGGVR